MKKGLILEREVQLCVRHGARLKPAIKHVFYAVQALSVGARYSKVVDEVAVEVGYLQNWKWRNSGRRRRVVERFVKRGVGIEGWQRSGR